MRPAIVVGTAIFVELCLATLAALAGVAPTTEPAGQFTDLASVIQQNTHVLRLAQGQYQVGPGTLDIPADFELIGAGRSTVIHAASGTKVALRLHSGSRLSNMHFDGHGVAKGNVNDPFISIPSDTANVTLDNLHIADCPRAAIVTDHASDIVIRNCRFERIALATNILFSRNVRVLDNTVVDATIHGLQFWGNWKWQQQDADNLLFSGNTLINGGNCCIWGSGARHVILANNLLDGAKDVGLDLEWCSDSVISANVARRCRNSGIALFFACHNVAITGNSIANDAPISAEDAKADWWVRSGIWLTYPNRKDFPDDRGHDNITIVGNAIACAPGDRRAMWIGSESHNIVIGNNAITDGQIWSGGHDGEHPMHLKLEPTNVVLNAQPPASSSTTPTFAP